MYLPTLPAVFWLAIYNTTHPPVKETAITALRKFDLTPCVTECFISEGDDWTFNMPVCTWCRKVTEEGYLDRFNKCREQNCGRDDFSHSMSVMIVCERNGCPIWSDQSDPRDMGALQVRTT